MPPPPELSGPFHKSLRQSSPLLNFIDIVLLSCFRGRQEHLLPTAPIRRFDDCPRFDRPLDLHAENAQPLPGKTMSYRYSRIDPSFDEHWEILYGW